MGEVVHVVPVIRNDHRSIERFRLSHDQWKAMLKADPSIDDPLPPEEVGRIMRDLCARVDTPDASA